MIDQRTAFTEEIYNVKEKAVVIITDAWADIADVDKQLLQKILQSVRLNLASVQIVHRPGVADPVPGYRVIFFGAPEVKTEANIVYAPSLSRLQNDPAGKQKLWIALKALFGL